MNTETTNYDALAELFSACYSDFVFDPKVLQAQDENNRAVSLPMQRWCLREGEAIIACGEYRQIAENSPPNRLFINIVVHPGYRGRGLGGQLYLLLMEHLAHQNDLLLRATVRAEDAHSLAFMQRRGFVFEQSLQEWALSLAPISGEPIMLREAKLPNAQMVICSVAELQIDSERNRKLHRLIASIRRDMLPATDCAVFSYETFEANYLDHPTFFPEMAFVAIHSGEYIGYSDLRDDGAEGLLNNLTGVLPHYRRQGVAMALKVRGLECARQGEYRRVRTFCSAENTAIKALNKRLRFVRTSAWNHLCRDDFNAQIN
jgi:mycothiol synthase